MTIEPDDYYFQRANDLGSNIGFSVEEIDGEVRVFGPRGLTVWKGTAKECCAFVVGAITMAVGHGILEAPEGGIAPFPWQGITKQ